MWTICCFPSRTWKQPGIKYTPSCKDAKSKIWKRLCKDIIIFNGQKYQSLIFRVASSLFGPLGHVAGNLVYMNILATACLIFQWLLRLVGRFLHKILHILFMDGKTPYGIQNICFYDSVMIFEIISTDLTFNNNSIRMRYLLSVC